MRQTEMAVIHASERRETVNQEAPACLSAERVCDPKAYEE